ncbi:MAG TPA: TVP38/TMEM64 family protein, partial [bacterium]|nr:TVP38/TMEM64 family protein [bacterium]
MKADSLTYNSPHAIIILMKKGNNIKNFLNKYWPHIISLIFFLLLIFISIGIEPETIQEFLEKMGVFAPITYIIIHIIAQIFAPISSTSFMVASFIVFKEKAYLYEIIVVIATSVINFTIARVWGRKVVRRLVGEKGIKLIDELNSKLGRKSLILLRFMTFFMNDFAAYAFGLTNIAFIDYFFASMIAQIPLFLVLRYTAAVADYTNVLSTALTIIILFLPFAIITTIYLRKSGIK